MKTLISRCPTKDLDDCAVLWVQSHWDGGRSSGEQIKTLLLPMRQ
jgi:hypothetical protein